MTFLAAKQTSDARHSMRRHALFAYLAIAVLIASIAAMSATFRISGAIVSGGTVVFAGYAKAVQHPNGGVVKEILVKEGQRVSEGQVLVELDPTIAAANRAIVVKGLDELKARRVRLEAERAGKPLMEIPPDLASEAKSDPVLASFLAAESQVFADRLAAREGQRRQLEERIEQINQQIAGLDQQARAKSDEIKLIGDELKGLIDLFEKKLVPQQRVSELRREEARLRGEHGQLIASIAEAQGRITETRLQIIQIDNELQDEVSNDLSKLESQYVDLEQQRVAAQDQLRRLSITAPVNGVVEGLAVHTVGGVIEAGSTIMQIAPTNSVLSIETKVSPSDIDQISLGQEAILRFSAFNQRTTPEIRAEVSLVPADLTTDPRTGVQYYLVRLAIDEGELNKLKNNKIVPGMPVESFIQTGDRSIISYFTKPLSDQLNRTFRHD